MIQNGLLHNFSGCNTHRKGEKWTLKRFKSLPKWTFLKINGINVHLNGVKWTPKMENVLKKWT